MTDPIPGLPDLAVFDPAATRGAVFRGLLRTAIIALSIYAVFMALGPIVGRTSYRLHDGRNHFDRVLVQGWIVGHPGVAATNGQGSSSPTYSWKHATKVVTFRQRGNPDAQIEVTEDLFGRVSVTGDVSSPLDRALYEGQASRAQAEAFVKGLPDAALTTAVVVLATPLSETAAEDFRENEELSPSCWFYEDPFRGTRNGFSRQEGSSYFGQPRNPVSWPQTGLSNFYRGRFSDWTAQLSSRDDGNLARLGLPGSEELKKLGESAQIHGFLIRDLTPTQLQDLLQKPAVGSITPVDVRFDILDKDQSS